MRAGDCVRHRPTGEKWRAAYLVASLDGKADPPATATRLLPKANVE
jgi:hypothetical protein